MDMSTPYSIRNSYSPRGWRRKPQLSFSAVFFLSSRILKNRRTGNPEIINLSLHTIIVSRSSSYSYITFFVDWLFCYSTVVALPTLIATITRSRELVVAERYAAAAVRSRITREVLFITFYFPA